jgi:hypothetical protein
VYASIFLPSHTSWGDHSDNIWWIQIISSSLYSFLHSPVTSSLLLRQGFRASDQNSLCVSHPFYACYMHCPLHPSWFANRNIWWRVQIIKTFTGNFLRCLDTSFLLRPNILLGALFSKSLNQCASLSARCQVPYPHKTIGKITVLYILICTFLNNILEYKMKLKVKDIPRI